MLEANPGVFIWSAPLTIAIRTIIILAFLLPATVSASERIRLLVATTGMVSSKPVPSLSYIIDNCADNILCAARLIRDSLGARARLETVKHPDSDTIRRVKSRPSLTGWKIIPPDMLQLTLDHFGRKTLFEINQSLVSAGTIIDTSRLKLTIDLRNNHGGALDKMLRTASLFLGHIPDAIRLTGSNHVETLPVPENHEKMTYSQIKLIVGSQTASSAEIFAALLRVHAGAEITGARTYGKNYLLRIIPVNHDWQLLVPAETVSIPGTDIVGGLLPDKISNDTANIPGERHSQMK